MRTSKYLDVLIIVLAIFAFLTKSNAQESAASGFQARLKDGIGQTFTALPKTFGEVTIKNPLQQVTTTEEDLENTFLTTKCGPFGGW